MRRVGTCNDLALRMREQRRKFELSLRMQMSFRLLDESYGMRSKRRTVPSQSASIKYALHLKGG